MLNKLDGLTAALLQQHESTTHEDMYNCWRSDTRTQVEDDEFKADLIGYYKCADPHGGKKIMILFSVLPSCVTSKFVG